MLENTLSCKYIAGGHCALAKRLLNQSSCRCSGYGFRFVKRRGSSQPPSTSSIVNIGVYGLGMCSQRSVLTKYRDKNFHEKTRYILRRLSHR
jgi:hypothetical protein